MILPADIEPRAVLGADAISYSELSTLAACEKKWAFSYGGSERVESQPSAAMRLGSEVHEMWGEWWMGGQPSSDDETAQWLIDRYASYYEADMFHGLLTARAIEQPLVARLPRGPYFFGFADGLFDVAGMSPGPDGLWIAELKTARDFSSIRHLTQSPQGPLYVWAARRMGLPVNGVLLDVVRTFRPTKKELPLADSFQRRWLTWTNDEIKQVVDEARRAIKIRRDLTVGKGTPLRNIGPACGWCPHLAPCFGLELEILEEDEA